MMFKMLDVRQRSKVIPEIWRWAGGAGTGCVCVEKKSFTNAQIYCFEIFQALCWEGDHMHSQEDLLN